MGLGLSGSRAYGEGSGLGSRVYGEDRVFRGLHYSAIGCPGLMKLRMQENASLYSSALNHSGTPVAQVVAY